MADRLLALLDAVDCAGKQVHDANVVATMLVHGIGTVVTLNTGDFERFTNHVRVLDLRRYAVGAPRAGGPTDPAERHTGAVPCRGYRDGMDDSDERDATQAIEAARAAVGAPADAQAVWRVVTRVDVGRPPYVLVGLTSGESGWVAAVSLDGEVQGYAADPAGARAWWVDVPEELVWAPGSWSRSPLYPLRRAVVDGEVVFLDHLGERVPGMASGRG